MPWQSTSVMEKRIEFVVRASSGSEVMSDLCEEYGISRVTGYHWLRKYERTYQVTTLREESRRPHVCPHQTSSEIEAKVVALRRQYGWGARKLACLLADSGVEVPEITINRIIKRNNLIPPRDEHHQALQRFEKSSPNELWQVDCKGPMRNQVRKSTPLSLLDDFSRFAVGLHDLDSLQGVKIIPCFKRTFKECGLPNQILLDHGTPWWTSFHQLGLTKTAVWLIKQDIKLCFSRIRHPQTQGKVERFHRTLGAWVRHHKVFESRRWQPCLDAFRKEYNELRPHEALSMKVPASRYSPSLRPYTDKPLPWDYNKDKGPVIKLDTQGKFRRNGKHLFVCEALASEYVQLTELPGSLLVAFRDMYIREIYPDSGTSAPLVCSKSNFKV